MKSKAPRIGISGSTLKLLAILSMFIDHAGATVIRTICNQPAILADASLRSLWNQIYSVSRSIGRIAFPIFCFLIVEGFLHTRNVRKYALRLFLFALISEIPFDLALKGNWYYPQKQNVYFTLLIGLLVLAGFRYLAQGPQALWQKAGPASRQSSILAPGQKLESIAGEKNVPGSGHKAESAAPKKAGFLRGLLIFPILAAGMYLAAWIDTDYNFKGVFLIAVLYLMKQSRLLQCAAGACAVAWELPAPLAFLPIGLYNGSRGRQMKYFFYWFYPVHLLLLHAISKYLIPWIL